MRTTLMLSLAAAVALSGCAQRPHAGPPPTISPAPVCTSKPQCDAMWSEALVQIQNISGMRIQTATDTYVQTFNATDVSRMNGSARLVPHPNGTSSIEATFSCGYCGNQAYSGLNLFIAQVNLAGAPFGSTAPATAPTQQTNVPGMQSEQAYKEQQLKQLMQQGLPYAEYQRRYKEIVGSPPQ